MLCGKLRVARQGQQWEDQSGVRAVARARNNYELGQRGGNRDEEKWWIQDVNWREIKQGITC